MSKVQASWSAMVAMAAVLLLTFTLSASADAATVPGTSATPRMITSQATVYYQLANFHTNACLSEHGTTGVVYLEATCSTNHSNYWTFSFSSTTASEMLNLHSNHCLNVTGTESLVDATSCTGNHAQFWYEGAATPDGVEIKNYHSGLCLWWNGSVVVQQGCNTSNHADLWYVPVN
jgi:hypothetical protein